MTFIKSTLNHSPFATSTTIVNQGPSAWSQSWVSVSGSTSSISGSGFASTAAQSTSNSRKYYYTGHSNRILSGHLYHREYQTITECSDECICVDNSFLLERNGANLDSSVSRSNIIKIGH